MKRLVAVALTVVLLMSSAMYISVSAEETAGLDDALQMCTTDDGTLCFLVPDGVLLYRNGKIIRNVPCEGAMFVDSCDGILYVLCRRGSDYTIVCMDRELKMLREMYPEFPGKVTEFTVTRTCAACIATNTVTYEDAVYLYDFASETVEEQEYRYPCHLSSNAECFVFGCEDMMEDVLAVIYPEEGMVGIAVEQPPYGPVYMLPDEDACIIREGGTLYYVEWSDGMNNTVSMQMDKAYALMDAGSNMVYCYDGDAGQIRSIAYSDIRSLKGRKLVIADLGVNRTDPYEKEANTYFLSMHPGCSIEYRNYATTEKMRLALMSSDCDADVLLLGAEMSPAILCSGVFTDLRSFECIRDLETMPQISGWPFRLMESGNGELYVLPAESACEIWEADAKLLKRYGLEMPDDDWTWQDLIDMGRKLRQENGIYIAMNGSYPLEQYCAQTIDLFTGTIEFDTPGFRTMLEIQKTLSAEELLADPPVIFSGEAECLFWRDFTAADEPMTEFSVLPPHGEGLSAAAPFSGMLLGVYSAGEQQELAAEYIADYYLYPLAETVGIHKGDVRWPPFYTDIALYIANRQFADEEEARRTLNVFEHTDLSAVLSIVLRDAGREWELFMDGEQNADETIAHTQECVDMWLNE